MAGFIPRVLQHGCHQLSSSTTTTCTLADTYYKIGGTWIDGNGCNNAFTYDGTGKITFTGQSGTYFLFTGVSDLSVNVASRVTYGLYKNGVLVTGAETPTDFVSSSKVGEIGISHIFPIQKGDYFEIYVKSDGAGNIVTHNTLMLTFVGDR